MHDTAEQNATLAAAKSDSATVPQVSRSADRDTSARPMGWADYNYRKMTNEKNRFFVSAELRR